MPSALVRRGAVLLAPSSCSPFATCPGRCDEFRHAARRARHPGCLRNSSLLGLARLSSRRHASARGRPRAAALARRFADAGDIIAAAPLPTTPAGAYHVRREAPPMGGFLKIVAVV